MLYISTEIIRNKGLLNNKVLVYDIVYIIINTINTYYIMCMNNIVKLNKE